MWPSFRPNGDPLLYLASQPIVEGLGKCDFVTEVNPYQVKVRNKNWSVDNFASRGYLGVRHDINNAQDS